MSDIKARRNSLLKSSISINSIRSSVTNFTKGLFSSRETASEIVTKRNIGVPIFSWYSKKSADKSW